MEKPNRVTITIKGPKGQFEYQVPTPSPWQALWILVLTIKLVVLMLATTSAAIDCVNLLASLVR
jgi:hypothetical protein